MPQSHVAIVDDDASLRRALTRLLHSAGLQVAAFASAEEFLASGGSSAPACLILDIHLTGMSGLELLTRLRAAGDDLPVLLITAHDDQQNRTLAAQLRCRAYLRKPLDPSKLLKEVLRALDLEEPAS